MKPLHPSKPSLFDRLLSLIEVKPASDRLILRVFFLAIVFSGVWLIISVNHHYSALTPIRGGTFKEGVVGTPRFINPALAIARADQDVTALIYSGLMKINDKGELVPDIAESVTTSDDGLTYNVILRKDIHFHDGTQLTAKDVEFTIDLIKNPDLKSPLRGNWSDVNVEVVNDYELNIVLKNPYVPFKENFLVGIMPAHLWSQIPVEQLPFNKLNTEPVGSGPFKIKTANRDVNGLINGYTLAANKATPTPPKIDTFELHFYNDEETLVNALKKGAVDASAYVANEDVTSLTDSGNFKVVTEPLPRVFGMFFNQNKQPALRDPAVREALDVAIDRNNIIATALKGQGVPITTPMPESSDTLQSTDGSNEETPASRVERAQKILTDAGWSKNNLGLLEKQIDGSATTLSLTVRTSNVPLFNTVSQMVADEWKAIGVEVSTEQFEQTGLVQTVIRPRDFEVLLFGLDMSRAQDLYPFWHSSQKDDPGLNISQYTNLSVDTLLEKARTEQDQDARNQALKDASTVIKNERPAIFLFEPMMTYVVKKNVVISDIHNIGKPSDRFGNITDWYTDSDNIWNIFKVN
jgi:peptide/nickel transport system substrate-binding protein